MIKHPPEFTDTDPRTMDVWLEVLRRMTPGERIDATLDLSNLALQMSDAGVRSVFPMADDREVRLRVAARHLSRDLMIRAYHWDLEAHGDAS